MDEQAFIKLPRAVVAALWHDAQALSLYVKIRLEADKLSLRVKASERELAKKLGISRPVLRVNLSKLAALGLVVRGRGYVELPLKQYMPKPEKAQRTQGEGGVPLPAVFPGSLVKIIDQRAAGVFLSPWAKIFTKSVKNIDPKTPCRGQKMVKKIDRGPVLVKKIAQHTLQMVKNFDQNRAQMVKKIDQKNLFSPLYTPLIGEINNNICSKTASQFTAKQKKTDIPKGPYNNVFLSDKEFFQMKAQRGMDVLRRAIDRVSQYKHTYPDKYAAKYKTDAAALRSWGLKAGEERLFASVAPSDVSARQTEENRAQRMAAREDLLARMRGGL